MPSVERGPDIGLVEELQIPVNGGEITLRIYRPTQEQSAISAQEDQLPPVHINFHGGGMPTYIWNGNQAKL